MQNETFRTISTSFLIKEDNNLIAFVPIDKLDQYENQLKESDIKYTVTKFTSNIDRLNELGENLFTHQFNCGSKEELISFRNNIIVEWKTLCEKYQKDNGDTVIWAKLLTKYNLPNMTSESFCRCVLDKLEYSF
jgi:hypothetical protein